MNVRVRDSLVINRAFLLVLGGPYRLKVAR